jgi:hemolysin activation/secretion protein
LRDGGRMQLRVIDGYIESVQTDGVPEPVRAAVRARLAWLVGRRHLRWAQLEHQVLLAGSVPGLRLGSALLPGTVDDGVRLAVDGSFESASVRVGIDNELPFSLGGKELDGSLVLNSPFGLGEQWLVSQTRGLGSAVHDRAPLNSTALGAVVPIGSTGITAAPQVVRVDTAPTDTPGAPTSTGAYRRESLTFDYPLWTQRVGRVDAEGVIEQIAQWQRAVDFGVDLNRDIYRALRLQMKGELVLSPRNAVRASLGAGLGLGGRTQAQADESGVPLSRLGASSQFRKLGIDVSQDLSFDGGWSLETRVLAQSSFGHPLLRPESLALDGAGQVSAFHAGDLSFDQGLLTRIELQRTDELAVQGGHWVARPYAFVAAGHGHLFHATALEPTVENAQAVGLGWRSDSFDMARTSSLHFELEGSRGWLDWPKSGVRTTWIALAAWRF